MQPTGRRGAALRSGGQADAPRSSSIETMTRRTINPWKWQDRFGFVQAEEIVGATATLYCSGQTSTDASGVSQHPGDMRAQLTLAIDNLETVLTAAGYTIAEIVRLNFYTTDVDQFLEHFDVVARRLIGVRYSSTLLGVTRLAGPELLVEIEATASR
jgi:enamine deaminase RidA (YjgF/YER057c/UK114 family)